MRLQTAADIATTGFARSPTVIVDGHDLFPGTAAIGDLTARLYSTSEGLHGAPTLHALKAALSQRGQ
jgi:hypothetical protein